MVGVVIRRVERSPGRLGPEQASSDPPSLLGDAWRARRERAITMAKGKGRPPKNILLFSDGTGNSSAKLQKTNVWRLYEALDLGAIDAQGRPADPVQIAYYDNGVGTSSVPLLAAIGGAFGFGLARNVRALYKFLCRNYE